MVVYVCEPRLACLGSQPQPIPQPAKEKEEREKTGTDRRKYLQAT